MGAEAVVVSGVYGSGKTSTIEEMADLLEAAGTSYGAVDLDWLWWFAVDGLDHVRSRRVLLANLAAVIANYRNAGVERFLLAWAIQDESDLDALRSTVGFPLRVAALTVPVTVVRARLQAAITVGREADLREAERCLAHGIGEGLADAQFAGDRPVPVIARDILEWLGWLSSVVE